jgi:hypothetical protein
VPAPGAQPRGRSTANHGLSGCRQRDHPSRSGSASTQLG